MNYYTLLYHIHMTKKNLVGGNIRRLRLEAAITQEELALRSGLSQGYINHLEVGKRKYTQKSLELIADALSVDVIDFFKHAEDADTVPEPAEKTTSNKDRQAVKKELLLMLKRLPLPIADHYLTLMKIESGLIRKQKQIQR